MAELMKATLSARRLARYLQALREAADLTVREVATELNCSVTTVYRIEGAKSGVTPDAVKALLDIYKLRGQCRDKLIKLAEDARQPGWWNAYKGIFKGRFIVMEHEATEIWEWGLSLVPGLLQTEAYARAVIQAGRPDLSEGEVKVRAAARMRRQELLTRDDPPALHVVLDEAVLLRPVGGPAVMHEQLRALLAWSELPNVTLQVLAFSAGAHSGMEGTFIVLGFGDDDPQVAYVEDMSGGHYREDRKVVERCRGAFGRLRAGALDESESRARIAESCSKVTP